MTPIDKLKQNIDNTVILEDWQKLTDQKLTIQIYEDIQLLLRHIRNKEYWKAEYKAADTAVHLAMLAAEERKG
ncbi:MAG TPA: hypothetical protein ENH82_08295 [bacterium]|nr:hypothetical protein [bacterium]